MSHIHEGARPVWNRPAWKCGAARAVRFGSSALLTVAAVLSGCASGGHRADPLHDYDPGRAAVAGASDFRAIYQRMGLAASGPPIGFVADVGFFATHAPDSTYAIVGLSLPNRGLTFGHTGSGYAASYVVTLHVDRDGTPVTQQRDSETVAVPSFKETTRTDESVIFRRALTLAPGSYTIAYEVWDVVGARRAGQSVPLVVPRLARGRAVSTPTPVYEASSRTQLTTAPTFLPAPRASLVYGVEDSAAVYVESYAGTKLPVTLRSSNGATAWTGSVALAPHGALASGVARIPLSGADIGTLTLVAGTAPDTMSAPLFLGFGPDLPVLSFDDMLNYLRFFVTGDRLRALRNAPPAERAQMWSSFLHASDPNPETPNNEALDAYFARIREANDRFRSDEGRGWLSDRGTVYVVLGEPNQVSEDYAYMYNAGDVTSRYGGGQRVRIQVWQYGQGDVKQIVFYDASDAGLWRLAPQSLSLFRSVLASRLIH